MIETRSDFDALAKRLTERAERMAQARAADLSLRDRPERWRSAALLWPHFAKG